MEPRIVAALGIIGICALGAVIALAIHLPRRRRERLRRRGVKTYEHRAAGDRRIA